MHIPPPLYLCGVLGYDGKLCVFGGSTRTLRRTPDDGEARTAAHLQEGAECHPHQVHSDRFLTNEYFEFDSRTREYIL